MKALRYLLITFAIMMGVQVVNATAQSLATEPQIGFQSTSSMVGSGSTLPQAATEGAYTTYEESSATAPTHEQAIRKGRPGDWSNPYEDPIGDGVIMLALCALAYLIVRTVRSRSRAVSC